MNRYRKYIWFSLAKFHPICYTCREKVYFCRCIRTYGWGSYEHRAPAVAPFYFGTKTWLSLDGFLWEWLYWSCPWCWAEYPALQHRLGTWVADTRTDSLILIFTGVCTPVFYFPFIDVRPCVWYTQVTGCVGSSVRRSDTGTGCLRGTLRLSGTKLILGIILNVCNTCSLFISGLSVFYLLSSITKDCRVNGSTVL